MEAALAAREEVGAGSASMAGDDAWEAASAASGLSAVSGLSVYTAAGQSGAPSASAGASAYAPSTVGGRKPARQRKQKVRVPLCLLLQAPPIKESMVILKALSRATCYVWSQHHC